jgi:hypothetical protein
MLVHVLSAYPEAPILPNNFAAAWLRESARLDQFGQHFLCDDPERADLILFVESHLGDDPFFLKVIFHPIRRKYPEKCFLYHDADNAIPLMRGVYPSIRQGDYLQDRCRSGWYIARIEQPSMPPPKNRTVVPKHLYTFIGANNSRSRDQLLSMPHPMGFVEDTSNRRLWALPTATEKKAFHRRFSESILDSQFSLCPAGIGPCSYRLFESMELGVAPVIISDNWVPFDGPSWERFSIRIPERHIPDLRRILEERATESEAMGGAARDAWEQWISQPVSFHHLVESCYDLSKEKSGFLSPLRAWMMLSRPSNLRTLIRPVLQSLRDRT